MRKLVAATLLALPFALSIAQVHADGPVVRERDEVIALDQGAAWTVGDRVEVSDKGKWYPSTILQMKDGKYFIHYEGFSKGYDTWVGTDRMRAVAAAPAPAPAKLDPYTQGDLDDLQTALTNLETSLAKNAPLKDLLDNFGAATSHLATGRARLQYVPQFPDLVRRYWAVATKEVDYQVRRSVDIAKGAADDHAEQDVRGEISAGPAQADKVIAAYKAYDGKSADELKRIEDVVAAGRAAIAVEYKRINRASLETTPMPADTYRGGDKAHVKTLLLASWAKAFPGEKVLAVRFPFDWERDASWQSSGGNTWWTDVSSLYVMLIVKADDETAEIYPCSVSGNAGNRAKLEVRTTKTGAGRYVPYPMLLKKVR